MLFDIGKRKEKCSGSFFLSLHFPPQHRHKHTDTHGHRSLDGEFLLYTWPEVRNWKYMANMEWAGVGRRDHLWGFLETSFPAWESSVRREQLRRGRRWQADQDRLQQGIKSVNGESETRRKKWRVMEDSSETSLYRIWQWSPASYAPSHSYSISRFELWGKCISI